MLGHPPDNQDEDVLKGVYDALKDPSKTETTNAELKSHGLTETILKAEGRGAKIAETIAAIANRGEPFGYVVCEHSGSNTENCIDPAKLDDIICRTVHPRVLVTLQRRRLNDNDVDFVIIRKSQNRPHIVRHKDNRFMVPLRGVGNNSTAARTELDLMYQERMVDQFRNAFPMMKIGEQDELGAYLDTIGYGLEKIDRPQYSLVVAPSTVPKPVINHNSLFGDDSIKHELYSKLVIGTINTNLQDYQFWFALNGFLNYAEGEDYLEIGQRYGNGGFRNAARIYDTGTVTYNSLIPTRFFEEGGYAYLPGWLDKYLAPTLIFASLCADHFSIPASEYSIRLALQNAQEVKVAVAPTFDAVGEQPTLYPMKEPSPFALVPKRKPITTTRAGLTQDLPGLLESIVRGINTLYPIR